MFKIIKKITKSVYILRGPHVDATWHSGPRGSATRAHAEPTRRIYTYIFYIFYIVGVFSLLYIGRVFKPPNPSGLINPMGFTNLFCVGLKVPHSYFYFRLRG